MTKILPGKRGSIFIPVSYTHLVIEHNTLSVTDKVNLKQDIEKLYEVLEKTLTPREKMVIELRYGLYNQKEKTQREIAEMLGISRSYVSRIEKNALAKLRKLLE